ncbi:hypothetical protein [Pontibacter korlensis]|uniref:hypothetical protein n=1 Tax=Pontibacter korlensis TaxID=400092 RepID=UPI0011DDCE72|nr:hypothetical protein [Pontibacter korlensis]
MILPMKQVLPFLIFLLITSCTSETLLVPQAQQQIREQIRVHYNSLQLEGYSPISNRGIDTIAVHRNQRGEETGIIGEITHRYRFLKSDSLTTQSQVFEVQVYAEDVVTSPAKPLPSKQPPRVEILKQNHL